MLRRKRYPVTKSGLVVTPEVADALAKEAEDIDPAELRPRVLTQPVVGKQPLVSRIDMHLRDFGDSVRWRTEDAVQSLGRFAREVRRHGKAKV